MIPACLSLLVATAITLSACAPAPAPIPADPDSDLKHAPAWVTEADRDDAVISALGTARGIDDPGALRRAALGNARIGVATQIATRLGTALSGRVALDDDVRHDVTAETVARNLYGPHRERYWVGPSGTCYVRYEIEWETWRENCLALRSVDDDLRAIVVAAVHAEDAPALAR